jgi:hypothetical protein
MLRERKPIGRQLSSKTLIEFNMEENENSGTSLFGMLEE